MCMMVAHAGERLLAIVRISDPRQGDGILCLSSQTHATVGAHQIGTKRGKKTKNHLRTKSKTDASNECRVSIIWYHYEFVFQLGTELDEP